MPLPESLPEHFTSPREQQTIHNERYLQDKKLGAGNFGTAYLVFDLICPDGEEEKKVLKRIHVGNVEPGETNDAKKEATLLSRLHHENVVQFHESFFDRNYFCIVTEFCDGGDMDIKLQEYKKKDEFVDESQVTEWLKQLLKALRYLHHQHILHRDLKAKNIFLKSNRVKLGDFGISKILMGTADMASTFVGTPYYMSPEVIKHDKYNDKSDIWSLGCILYEICTLKHAFDGQSLMAVMYKIVTGDIPHLPEMYSRELNDILGKMLAREQDERSSSKELLQHSIFGPTPEKDPSVFDGLTPKERLRLKKQRLADKEIRKLRELAEKTRKENERRHRESVTKNFHRSSIETSPPFDAKRPSTSYHPGDGDKKPKPEKVSGRSVGQHRTTTQTNKFSKYQPDQNSSTAILTPDDVVFADDKKVDSTSKNNDLHDPDLTLARALSFSQDGTIPDDEMLAETLYALTEDFEDDLGVLSDMESDYEDDTILNDSEYKEMLDHLQNALDIDSTLRADKDAKPVPNSAMSNQFVTSQIANMRKTCIDAMGEEVFNKAYSYLRRVWSNELMSSAPDYNLVLQNLSDIVKDDKKSFLLEQLVYLENETAQ